MSDLRRGPTQDFSQPSGDLRSITPSDTDDLISVCRGFHVGTVGDVRITDEAGNDTVIPACQPGVPYPYMARKIWNTNTTATRIIAIF